MEITFGVGGWPPAKNEAKSMLAAQHSHARRVRTLLEAARDALEASSWETTAEPIGLELIVHSSPHRDPWDATNYLGGVAVVLQNKTRSFFGLDLEHLGDLLEVALYQNDRQIREIHFSHGITDSERYSVRVWVLETLAADLDVQRPREADGTSEIPRDL